MPERAHAGGVPLQWHLARWREADPGRRGIVWLLVLTLVMCVPLERLGADLPWTMQTSIFLNLFVVLASVVFGREAALSDEVERWLVNQGYSPADWVLARWSANLLPLTAIAVLWALLVAAATFAIGQAPNWPGVFGLTVQLIASTVVLTLVLLAAGAAGTRQTSEVLLAVLIATLLLPLAQDRVPPLVWRALSLVLPPFSAIAALRDGVVNADWRDAALALLHIATWSTLVLGAALALVHRRVPERPSRARVSRG